MLQRADLYGPANPCKSLPAGAIDNYLAEGWAIPSNITVGAFCAPRSNSNAAAEQSLLDEFADPVDSDWNSWSDPKRGHVSENNDYDPDRYAGILKLVREKSNWD